jgi:VWFA-related protein
MPRRIRMAFVAVAALLSLGSSLALSAQPPAPQPPADQPGARFQGQANVNEVLLDVLVTDKNGNVIVGLNKNDFVIKENGKPVDLTGVTFYSNRRYLETKDLSAKTGLDIDRVPESRYFILFFDDQKQSSVNSPVLLSQQVQAGIQAKKWVQENLLPNDYVAVASYDFKLKIQQDFTHDPRALAAAIDAAVQGKDTEGNWPSRIAAAQAQALSPSLLAGLPRGNDLRDKTPRIYDGVRLLADSAGHITGRKNLVMFTHGFGTINNFGQYIPDVRFYPPMMHALNANNVAVYALDLVPAGINHPLANAMNQLALETGGEYYFNFTNFLTPLKQVSKENNGYYLLSYAATHGAEQSGFQKVTVGTTNPEFKVKAREGYEYGRTDAEGRTSR